MVCGRVFVEAMTENRNCTAAEVRHAFKQVWWQFRYCNGSVAYLFERKGQIDHAPGVDEEALMDAALESGADDIVINDDGSIEVLTTFADFIRVNEALTAAGSVAKQAEVTMISGALTAELDLEGAEKVMRLIDALEDLDDVQNVYSNAEFSDDVMRNFKIRCAPY